MSFMLWSSILNEGILIYCSYILDFRFHVDKLSSAHVYLRMRKGQTMEMVTPELLEDCAQLVKANSIQGLSVQHPVDMVWFFEVILLQGLSHKSPVVLEYPGWGWWKCSWVIPVGNKLNNLDVVYTPWYNLRKTQSMDVGQVGFHNSKLVRVCVLLDLYPCSCHKNVLCSIWHSCESL